MGGAYGTYGRDEERTQGLCRANLEKIHRVKTQVESVRFYSNES